MCGIVGSYCLGGNTSIYKGLMEPAVNALRRRGPDNQGIWYNSTVFLGHARLSILDTSDLGNQPMLTEDENFIIVFNGEVYNFKELIDELNIDKSLLKSNSDTEVILQGYKLIGETLFSKLNGFFGLAIYNKQKDELVIVRDRFGIKPLYYYHDREQLIFGSELKALLHLGIPKEINKIAVAQYFHLNYIPAPLSIFEGTNKLEPGHYLKISNKELTQHQYYNHFNDVPSKKRFGYEDAQNELTDRMRSSVQYRLISDVPIGTFLSGGIDSSVITALAAEEKKDLKTFSIGFKDNPFFDETEYALKVADKYKTDHTVYKLTEADQFNEVENLFEYFDEPFADSSALPVYILCNRVKEQITVALSGDGADEIFGGYNKYAAEYKQRNKGLKENLVSIGGPLWKTLPKSRNSSFGNLSRQLDKFASGSRLKNEERYWKWCGFGNGNISSLLRQDWYGNNINFSADYNAYKRLHTKFIDNSSKGIDDVLLSDLHLVLQNDMLVKVDRMSMANSLEVRVPFLDHNVVEFAFQLESEYKVNSVMKKRIVQDAFRNLLPQDLYNRPKKGFEVPLLGWLKTGLNEELLKYSNKEFLTTQGIFDALEIDKLLKKLHSKNPGDSHAKVWAFLCFQKWYDKYIMNTLHW